MKTAIHIFSTVLISTLVCAILVPGELSAASTKVTAVVTPVRIVTIDNQGNILQIQSNTPENVTPTGVLGDGKTTTILNRYTLRQYELILPILKSTYGVVYERPSETQLCIGEYLVRYLKVVSYQS